MKEQLTWCQEGLMTVVVQVDRQGYMMLKMDGRRGRRGTKGMTHEDSLRFSMRRLCPMGRLACDCGWGPTFNPSHRHGRYISSTHTTVRPHAHTSADQSCHLVLPSFPQDVNKEIVAIVRTLTSTDSPSEQRDVVRRYLTPNASFEHPLCSVKSGPNSRDSQILRIYQCIYPLSRSCSRRL